MASTMKQKLFPAQEEVKMIDSNDELTEDQKELKQENSRFLSFMSSAEMKM